MLTHRNLMANALHFQAFARSGPTRAGWWRRRCFTPPGSIAVLATVWHGGCQVVLPAFDPAAALDLMEATA